MKKLEFASSKGYKVVNGYPKNNSVILEDLTRGLIKMLHDKMSLNVPTGNVGVTGGIVGFG